MVKQSLRKKYTDRIVFILTVFLLSCFLIFEKYTWGKYAFFLASGLIFFIDISSNPKKMVLTIDRIHKCFGLFVIFCFLSVLWAINRSNALEWSKSLLNNLICITLIYPYYSKKKDVFTLFSVVMWASYIIAIYTIWFYGLHRLFASSYTQYVRLGNDFSNINTVGMFCAFGLIVQFGKLLYERRITWSFLFVIPSIIVVAATQSRKAIISVILGLIILTVSKNSFDRNIIKKIIKWILAFIIIGLLLFILSRLSIFAGVTERLKAFLPFISKVGTTDSSTLNRMSYIELGIKTWTKYPLGGVGINCPRIFNYLQRGENMYLHNNYVELLCGVGIVGFVIYYYMYFILLKGLIHYRENNNQLFSLGITWMILLFIMDFGMVSYYSKINIFYLMILFLCVKDMKNYPQISEKEIGEFNNGRMYFKNDKVYYR